MKAQQTILLLSIIIFSCTSKRRERNTAILKNVPDRANSSKIYNSRGNDIVDELYLDALDSNVNLQKLEEAVAETYNTKADSFRENEEYIERNAEFYRTAENHLNYFSDSSLKQELVSILRKHKDNYETLIKTNNEIAKEYEKRESYLKDLHSLIKVASTLELMRKYQQQALPSKIPMENQFYKLVKTIKLADSIKQSGM